MRIGLRQFAPGDYAGCYFLNANSREKPQVVDKQVQPILDQTEVYSGCYGYARRREIQLAYAIGMKEPVSVNVNCFGTASVPEIQLARMARRQYDLTPAGIISTLDLRAVDYTETSAYGHFGKPWLPWEK